MIEMNQDNIQDLRDKVADIKYDTQQVLDRIDSMDAAYQEQTGREEALTKRVQELESKLEQSVEDYVLMERELKAKLAESKETIAAQRGTIDVLEHQTTMPVIPKAVAIAIFREGVQHGVEAACTELEGQSIRIEESEYVRDFHVTFERRIDLDDELDLDWMRGKCGDYSEERAIEALGNLCAAEKFECRIHGVDDQQTKDND